MSDTKNKFTLTIHNKGWTVKEACGYWGIDYDTYNRRCNNERFHNQLISMCEGLSSIKNQSQAVECIHMIANRFGIDIDVYEDV